MFLCYHLNILWEQSVDFQESAEPRLQTLAVIYVERIHRLQSSCWTGIQQDMKALETKTKHFTINLSLIESAVADGSFAAEEEAVLQPTWS